MSKDVMSQEVWTEVDTYLGDCLVGSDKVLDEVLRTNTAAGLPAINVTPNQGKLLHLLARLQGARRILEIGTLGAYSTIWLARALPAGGRLVTLEVDRKHAEVASGNIERAGLGSIVELRIGPALESLSQLQAEGSPSFDFIFIDADKPNNPVYLEWALRLSRSGTLIVIDNVVRGGAIADPDDPDPAVQGTRRLFQMIMAERRLDATALQTVGSKGYDGFALALVR